MSRTDALLWIVHRDERLRAALRRLAGAGDEALLGSPDDAAFRDAPSPRIVLLGLAGDFEAELEFAHRLAERLPAARWLVLVDPADRSEAERLFDALPAEWLGFPPTASELRGRLRAAAGRRRQDELSKRRLRDALSARFARYFGDLELPEILRAVDPRLAEVPLLVLGEPGTGRGLLARYVHVFGGGGGIWHEIDCRGAAEPGELRAALVAADMEGDPRDPLGATVCLRDVDALSPAAQFSLRTWVELGPPGPLARARRLRWIATAGDDVLGRRAPGLAPELAEALAGLAQRLPALRERAPEALLRFASDSVLAWCRVRGERPRTLAADAQQALLEYPWPGNHRELEALLVRTLAAETGDPIRADQLRFELAVEAILPEAGGAERMAPGATPPARPERPRRAQAAPEAPEAGAAPGEERRAGELPKPLEPGQAEAAGGRPRDAASLRRLAQSLAHELRNGLVSIRTFAALLPERAEDRAFREEFVPTVGADVRRVEGVLERLARYAELPGAPGSEQVDVAALLEEQLEALRSEIEQRRLLVLKELDRAQPLARGDRASLAFAFEALLVRALSWMPERGDLYLASRAVAQGAGGEPSLRVVLRFHRPGERRLPSGAALPPERELALDVVLAELALRAQGATLRVDATDAEETVISVDLPVFGRRQEGR